MFGLTPNQLVVGGVAVAMVVWILVKDFGLGAGALNLLSTPFSWLTSAAEPDKNKAFSELQSLLAFAKSKAGCPAMVDHLNAAGKCLFGHEHDAPHPPAPETVA